MKTMSAAAIGLLMMSGAAMAADPTGVWLSADGGTKVNIGDCGGKLCGTVVWLQRPNDPATGKPKTDALNPDPAKRNRPMLGLRVVDGLTPSGPNRWSGIIYNADDGHVYNARVNVQTPTLIKVEGCLLMICKGMNWTRAN